MLQFSDLDNFNIKDNKNGFGIAKVYSNEETKNIIEQIKKPFFIQGQFYEGLKAGMLKMTEELRGRI